MPPAETPGFHDDSSIDDLLSAALGAPRDVLDLPAVLACKAGHPVGRTILTLTTEAGELAIPCYPCAACQVVYRYHECQLMPGTEGEP